MTALFAISELFYSFQGEGHYAGTPSLWVRVFGCNLQCRGFGQAHPEVPATYQQSLSSSPDTLSTLAHFETPAYGCDTPYAWDAAYKHLTRSLSIAQICDDLSGLAKNPSNPEGMFFHPHSRSFLHLCMTGGEPLLPHGQKLFLHLMDELFHRQNTPAYITFETNGTQPLSTDFMAWLRNHQHHRFEGHRGEVFFSVSPKLFSVAGEAPEKALRPDVVAAYAASGALGQLKFVMTPSAQAWDDMEIAVARFRAEGVPYPVWVMAVGDGLDDQAAALADETVRRGYRFAVRGHCAVYHNAVGK